MWRFVFCVKVERVLPQLGAEGDWVVGGFTFREKKGEEG